MVVEVEGSPEVRKEEGISAPLCTVGCLKDMCLPQLENGGSGKGQRKALPTTTPPI